MKLCPKCNCQLLWPTAADPYFSCPQCGYEQFISKPPVLLCADCGKPITEGQHYLDMGDDQYCLLCAEKRCHVARKVAE